MSNSALASTQYTGTGRSCPRDGGNPSLSLLSSCSLGTVLSRSLRMGYSPFQKASPVTCSSQREGQILRDLLTFHYSKLLIANIEILHGSQGFSLAKFRSEARSRLLQWYSPRNSRRACRSSCRSVTAFHWPKSHLRDGRNKTHVLNRPRIVCYRSSQWTSELYPSWSLRGSVSLTSNIVPGCGRGFMYRLAKLTTEGNEGPIRANSATFAADISTVFYLGSRTEYRVASRALSARIGRDRSADPVHEKLAWSMKQTEQKKIPPPSNSLGSLQDQCSEQFRVLPMSPCTTKLSSDVYNDKGRAVVNLLYLR